MVNPTNQAPAAQPGIPDPHNYGSPVSGSSLPGSPDPGRFVGSTASGHPTSGTYALADYVVDQTGTFWICTAAGTPGTWTNPAAKLGPAPVVLPAGNTSAPVLTFTSGTLETTATAGGMEFDGTDLYFTAAGSSRQVVDAEQFQCLASPYTLANNTNAQALFNATTSGALAVQGATSYAFEMEFDVSSLSASSHTIDLGFALTNSATLTSSKYVAVTAQTSGGAADHFLVATNSATAICAANTNTTLIALVRGVLRVNHAGTVTPQITQVTASAAAVIAANSWIRLWPIGSNTVADVGDWS